MYVLAEFRRKTVKKALVDISSLWRNFSCKLILYCLRRCHIGFGALTDQTSVDPLAVETKSDFKQK